MKEKIFIVLTKRADDDRLYMAVQAGTYYKHTKLWGYRTISFVMISEYQRDEMIKDLNLCHSVTENREYWFPKELAHRYTLPETKNP